MGVKVALRISASFVVGLFIWAAPAAANDYVADGTIVVDSGFRPDTNGYSFQNYGNEKKPANLNAVNMQTLFGPRVCIAKSGAACKLTPGAEAWRKKQNAGMAGGHCEGMAISSSFFFAGIGGTPPVVPELTQTQKVQRAIAYTFVFQYLDSVFKSKVKSSPKAVLNTLSKNLPKGEPMVLGIYKRGPMGGHAMTPLAIEDEGGGNFAILVYDNNNPGVIREVNVNTNTNTWNYEGSTNPAEPADTYEGDAKTKTLEIEFARKGLGVQPCPSGLCKPKAKKKKKKKKAARAPEDAGDQPETAQLLWEGDPDNGQHSDFTVTDADGNTTGCTGNKCVNEIPGAESIAPKFAGVEVWNQSAPPVVELPDGGEYEVDFDADGLEGDAEEGFSLIRDGVMFSLDDLDLQDGDEQSVKIDDREMTLINGSDHGIEPTLSYGDIVDGEGYEVAVRTSGLDDDSKLELSTEPGNSMLELDLDGDKGEEARITTVVTLTDEDGDVDVAKSDAEILEDGEQSTVS
ncbi:MAG TPA: hypothetical protein VD766_04265, partial [Solirubrobacterales bacterium]|nr:hypothetical protein [Solirubrobacterales bacterium]